MAHKLKTLVAAGMKGINSDIAPWDLEAEFITAGENFRITADKIISTGSEEDWSQAHDTYSYSGYIKLPTSGSGVPVGYIYHADDELDTLYFNKTGALGVDYSDELEAMVVGDIITIGSVTWTITSVTDGTTYMAFGINPATQLPVNVFPVDVIMPTRFYAARLQFVPASTGGEYWMVMGRTKVMVFDGGSTPATAWHDISSAAGYSSIGINGELNWTSCMLGSIPLINNPAHYPEYWSPQSTSTVLVEMDFDATYKFSTRPTPIKAEVIRSHKNYVFLLDLTEGATELPSSYRWSHPADNNGLPPSFDETDLNYIAGKAQIGGDSGRLLDGRTLRDSFVLYSEYAVNILDESYDEFVWRRRTLSSSFGLLNKNSLVEVKGTHFFIGDGDIYKNDGNSVDSILHNRLKKRFNAQASSDYFDRSYAVRNNAFKEIWFCIPEVGSEYPDTAFVYNWRDDSWAIQKIPNTVAHAQYGAQVTPPLTFDDYVGTGISFDDLTQTPFDSQVRTPLNQNVIGVCVADSCLKILDPQITQSADIDSYIERIGYPLDGQRKVNTLVRLYPHMTGSQDVNITVGSQQYAGAPIVWGTTQTFNPETDRKLDVRSTGMLHCWKIESIGTGMFEFTGMDLEYSPSGVR